MAMSMNDIVLHRNRLAGSECLIPSKNDFPSHWNQPHMTGTTVMAIEYDGGVVLGADCRSTTGEYIANRNADKLTRVSENIYCCRSGSAAATQALAGVVSYHLNFHRMELGEDPRVELAAALFQDMCYNYRDSLTAGIIVAGWDKYKGGQVYMIPIGGMKLRQPMAIGGSGSTYVYGYVDAHYKPDMTKDECLKFVANSITLGIERDGSSGGSVGLGVISKDGVERRQIFGNELPKFYTG